MKAKVAMALPSLYQQVAATISHVFLYLRYRRMAVSPLMGIAILSHDPPSTLYEIENHRQVLSCCFSDESFHSRWKGYKSSCRCFGFISVDFHYIDVSISWQQRYEFWYKIVAYHDKYIFAVGNCSHQQFIKALACHFYAPNLVYPYFFGFWMVRSLTARVSFDAVSMSTSGSFTKKGIVSFLG